MAVLTKYKARNLTKRLLHQSHRNMKDRIEKAFSCGALDLYKFDDDYQCPKIILYAILKQELVESEPHTKDDKDAAENLYLCL